MTQKDRSTAKMWGWITGVLAGVLMIADFVERIFQVNQYIPWWTWLCLLVLTPCIFAVHYYRHSLLLQQQKDSLQQRLPSTVTLFLPLENSGPDSRKDGKSQLDGIAQFISNECDLTKHIHLKIVDSALPRSEANKINNDAERRAKRTQRLLDLAELEYESGCRYFFCTMSQVLADFAPAFRVWAEKKGKDGPKLVATVAAAPFDVLDGESIFRYYPRAEDEAVPLAEWMEEKKIKHAIVVRVDSTFGEAMESALDDECSKRGISCIFLPALQGSVTETSDNIRIKLNDQIQMHSGEKDHCCIVLVLYGQSLSKTIEAISGISTALKIASTSTLTTEIAAGHIFETSHKWVLCKPVLRNRANFCEDIIAFYVHAALERYAKCIVACKGGKTGSFADNWTALPTEEDVHWDRIGNSIDSRIAMKVVAHP